MVFSSVPVYLDPPNWQQQPAHQNHQLQHNGITGTGNLQQLSQPLLHQLPPLPPPPVSTGGGGLIRPVSMTDRARLAKLPLQDAAPLKCPRCDSTNTKFCYYNNYSLTQPRHFCKTCRRYWTRGGALRNVPVGGGCRRNKKNKTTPKSSSSSSSANEKIHQMGSTNTNTITSSATTTSTSNEIILPNLSQQSHHHHHQLPYMSSLQGYNLGNHLGLNFAQIGGPSSTSSIGNAQNELGFQIGTNNNNSTTIFPSFFEPSTSVFNFHSEGIDGPSNSRASPVKMEDNNQGLNLARPFFSAENNNNNININNSSNPYWSSGSTWMDLSGLNSSSANHML